MILKKKKAKKLMFLKSYSLSLRQSLQTQMDPTHQHVHAHAPKIQFFFFLSLMLMLITYVPQTLAKTSYFSTDLLNGSYSPTRT